EAETVLHDVDAEEHAQKLLAAQRSFRSGMDAYIQGDTKRAGSIFVNIDINLLPPQDQQRLREIMATRELQPVAQAGHKQVLQASGQDKGVATTGSHDEPLDQYKAM